MNKKMILYILGCVICCEAALLLLPSVIALVYGEADGVVYLQVSLVASLIGIFLIRKKPNNRVFYAKEGFVSVAMSWIIMSLIGALPLYLTNDIPSYIDALFEIVSGFTTTGSSILVNVELLSHTNLFWRSFSHWIGGMGVLVFILAIVPLSGGYNMHLMKAESPGPSVGKLVPKIRSTAKILYGIYLFMTVLLFLLLVINKMPWFDAICMSFGTAGTGGFGILADSCASYTPVQQSLMTIFMILFGVNFNVYYLLLIRKFKYALGSEELRYYLIVIVMAILLITLNINHSFPNFFTAMHHAAFQVASIITTSGFATVNFDLWPEFSKMILVLLMFIGASAGSTGGGMKISRVVLLLKTMKKELQHSIHPRSVKIIQFEQKPVEHTVLRSINVFVVSYAVILILSLLIISLDNFDFATNFTAVVATINNIGPGLSKVGPMGSFADYSDLSKLVLSFNMLAGRLELFPILLLISPGTWKKS